MRNKKKKTKENIVYYIKKMFIFKSSKIMCYLHAMETYLDNGLILPTNNIFMGNMKLINHVHLWG